MCVVGVTTTGIIKDRRKWWNRRGVSSQRTSIWLIAHAQIRIRINKMTISIIKQWRQSAISMFLLHCHFKRNRFRRYGCIFLHSRTIIAMIQHQHVSAINSIQHWQMGHHQDLTTVAQIAHLISCVYDKYFTYNFILQRYGIYMVVLLKSVIGQLTNVACNIPKLTCILHILWCLGAFMDLFLLE